MTGDWACEAYGPDALEFGARCFLAELHERHCVSPAVCHVVMTDARIELHGRLTVQAVAGDEVARAMLAEFPTPDSLLGGSGDLDSSAVDAPPGSGNVES